MAMSFSVGASSASSSTARAPWGGPLLAWAAATSASGRRRAARAVPRRRRRSLSCGPSSSSAPCALFPVDSIGDSIGDASSMAASTALLSPWTTDGSVGRSPLEEDVARWARSQLDNAVLSSDSGPLLSSSPLSSSLSSSSSILTSSSKPDRSPGKEEVALLQSAFASFYGPDRNVPRAYDLLTECIGVWEGTSQSGDEIAGLYRVRGDVDMELFQPKNAEADYGKAIEYLEGPDGDKADPEELPASRLGRARAIRSLGSVAAPSQALQAAKDYEMYFVSISEENGRDAAILDGVQRNPYAAWEWGMVLRVAGDCDQAAKAHALAANAFLEIGDKPRSAICALDQGIDMANGLDGGGNESRKQLVTTKQMLEDAIEGDVNVGGRDVRLLQRLVAKEGEARIALAGILWSDNSKGAAEAQYGTACARLDELNVDYRAREEEQAKTGRTTEVQPRGAGLGFSMEDIVGADEAGCSRFRNERFVKERLVWNDGLKAKVRKFLALGR